MTMMTQQTIIVMPMPTANPMAIILVSNKLNDSERVIEFITINNYTNIIIISYSDNFMDSQSLLLTSSILCANWKLVAITKNGVAFPTNGNDVDAVTVYSTMPLCVIITIATSALWSTVTNADTVTHFHWVSQIVQAYADPTSTPFCLKHTLRIPVLHHSSNSDVSTVCYAAV